ncbi:MAG: sel1 repeat family protein [Beijerinckiaceae bacterium]
MARMEFSHDQASVSGAAPADAYLTLGLACAAGRDGAPDLVEAHKWLNIAAMRGCREAIARRAELACEMQEAQIAAAQRAAREWLRLH